MQRNPTTKHLVKVLEQKFGELKRVNDVASRLSHCVLGRRTQPVICVGCFAQYWVRCAINKGDFFKIAFLVVVDTHLPRFEALMLTFSLTLTNYLT